MSKSRSKSRKAKEAFRFNTQPQLTRLHGAGEEDSGGGLSQREDAGRMGEKLERDHSRPRVHPGCLVSPLEYDAKRCGFYFTEPVGKFPVVPISEQELVSVFIAQKALHKYRGTPFEAPLRSAFEKLVSSLEGELSVAWEDLDAAISFRGIETERMMPGWCSSLRRRFENGRKLS